MAVTEEQTRIVTYTCDCCGASATTTEVGHDRVDPPEGWARIGARKLGDGLQVYAFDACGECTAKMNPKRVA